MTALTRLFFTGDVMTGRGIDQIMSRPNDPRLFEPSIEDAREYVALAERRSGAIHKPVDAAYIWGDALSSLALAQPQLGIINLETAVTDNDRHWPDKGIHYRMHPDNATCVKALGIVCCNLANNHVLDWNYDGLHDTVRVLNELGIAHCGAGADSMVAAAPASFSLAGEQRLLVFGFGLPSSGVPREWAATALRPGVNWLPDLSPESLQQALRIVESFRRADDIVVVSIHWGPNWGYDISGEQRHFARGLIDGGADFIHGHSSHHPIGMECYRDHLICYGCGDFINDYEGIRGYDYYRPHLSLLYLLDVNGEGELTTLEMLPLQVQRLQLRYASLADAVWLGKVLKRESRESGISVRLREAIGQLPPFWLDAEMV
jgi:poly-gamma-glutamate synthesis protein (capsule biosynthesis protein)